jgi:mannose/fructose/N-acetylgalactosamine-specific phosphotransferase system component IIB
VALKLVRVDDRLIHGQVGFVWLRAIGADMFLIIDDATAKDPFMRSFLVDSHPQGTTTEVCNLEDGAVRMKELAAVSQGVFVIMKSPVTAKKLRDLGVEFDMLNIGGMGAGPGRNKLYKNISAGPAEMEAMRALEAMGTKVEFRIVPDDKPITFASLDKK